MSLIGGLFFDAHKKRVSDVAQVLRGAVFFGSALFRRRDARACFVFQKSRIYKDTALFEQFQKRITGHGISLPIALSIDGIRAQCGEDAAARLQKRRKRFALFGSQSGRADKQYGGKRGL